jgi:hypothetical protein
VEVEDEGERSSAKVVYWRSTNPIRPSVSSDAILGPTRLPCFAAMSGDIRARHGSILAIATVFAMATINVASRVQNRTGSSVRRVVMALLLR